MNHLAYLSLGSNINPEQNLRAAIQQLANYGTIQAISSLWETAPVGYPDQANYFNAALILETALSAQQLREEAIETIEQALHRVRTSNPNAPRTMDIDIVLFNQDVLAFGKRQIPHPDILTRAFVTVPLAEIAPDYLHPVTGTRLADIAQQFDLKKEGLVRRGDIVI